MKKVIYLWVALLLTAMPLLRAQNPVRNLKAEVDRNRYVRLSWAAPFADENAKAGEAEAASFEFWKKTVQAGSDLLYRYGDTVLRPCRWASKDYDSAMIWWEWLVIDKEDQDVQEVRVVKVSDTALKTSAEPNAPTNAEKEAVMAFNPNSQFMNKVGKVIYGVNPAKAYRTEVLRFGMDDYSLTSVFPIADNLNGMTYVPEGDGGNGALALLYGSEIKRWTVSGEALDEPLALKFADVPVPEGGKAYTATALAYYNGIYYAIGHHDLNLDVDGVKLTNYYIDAFDAATGAYIGRQKDLAEYEQGVYIGGVGTRKSGEFAPKHLFVATDPKTNNIYLVVSVTESAPLAGNPFGTRISAMYYFEIATSSTVVEYDVMRNGTELTAADYKRTYFLDTLTTAGDYTYTVAARYGELNVSTPQEVKVTIAEIGECPAPTDLTAAVYNRNYVALGWKRPVRQDDIKADRYVVSRDGKEIGVSDYAGFVDSVVPGTYTYTVRAEYTNSGVSAESAEVSVPVSGKVAAYAPRNLSAVSYIDDKGEGRVDLGWEAPIFGEAVTQSYSEMEAGGSVESNVYGMGVIYEKGDLAHLTGYAMDKVAFVLNAPGKYIVTVYKDRKSVFSTVIDKTGETAERMEVALDAPVEIEADADYLVGVVADAAMGAGKGITSDKSAKPVSRLMSAKRGYEESMAEFPQTLFGPADASAMTGNYNIEAHFSSLQSTELEGGNSDFEGYAVYRDGAKLPDVLVKELAYSDVNVPDGDHTYTVASVWKGGSDLQSNAVSKNVETLYGAPDNFNGSVSADTVSLTWQAPLSGAPVVKRWDSGKNAGKLGNKEGGLLYVAALFTPDDMKSFAGFSIKQVEFFLGDRARTLAIVIYNGETLIYEQELIYNLKFDNFNVIDLERLVAFDATKDLRVGLKVEPYVRDGRPIGVDATESADGKGNQISLDGKAWASASEQGVKNNFNIAFTVQYYNNKEVAAKGVAVRPLAPVASAATVFEPSVETVLSGKVSKLDNNEFSGFNVYRNDEKLTAEPIKDLAYTDITADSGRYAYKVSAVYTLTDEMFSQSLTFDTKKPGTGGDVPGDPNANEWDAQADGVRIYPNPAVSTLYVSGAYDSFRMTDLYGRTVMPRTAAAPAIEVSGLPSGQYLLILTKDGKESIQKITVR